MFAFLKTSISLQQFSNKVERVWFGEVLVLLRQSEESFFLFFGADTLLYVLERAALVANAS